MLDDFNIISIVAYIVARTARGEYFTWADTLRKPDDVASDIGYVISAANSKPIGR